MIVDRSRVTAEEFLAQTGWELKREGACRGDVCVPLGGLAARGDGRFDVAEVAERMHMPLVADEAYGVFALGPQASGHVLSSAELPELVLPDFEGGVFDVAGLRGRKVLLLAWASW